MRRSFRIFLQKNYFIGTSFFCHFPLTMEI